MTAITMSELRKTLPAQLDRVERGEEVPITRHGRVVAVLVGPAELARRRASASWATADALAAKLERARAEPLSGPILDTARADELVAEISAGRER